MLRDPSIWNYLVNGVNRFGFLGNHDFLVCQNELARVGVGIILRSGSEE